MTVLGEALFEAPIAHEATPAGVAGGLYEAADGRLGPLFEWEQVLGSHRLDASTGPAQLGHSLTMPSRFSQPISDRPDDELDPFDIGDIGHGRIEADALRGLVRSQEWVDAVYFGNWQRDVSQLIAPAYPKFLGATAARGLSELIFEVLDVIAEAKFKRRLTRERLGTYRWEEHCDNPREYGVAIDPRTYGQVPTGSARRRREDEPEATDLGLHFWRERADGLPEYLHAARGYVLGQLERALAAGPDLRGGRGLEHFGNAMHTVEDLFAHSNFVELGVRRLTGRGDPMTGVRADTRQPMLDGLGRLRLTTSICQLADTAVILQKFLLQQIQGPKPGAKPSDLGAKVTRVLIRRVLGPSALRAYDLLMSAWQRSGIPGLIEGVLQATGVPALQRAFYEQIEYPLRSELTRRLRPLYDASKRRTGTEAFKVPVRGQEIMVIEQSHSKLAKDETNHVHHEPARQLATIAVRELWREMNAGWSGGYRRQGRGLAGTRLPQLVDRYMNHPQARAAGEWWSPTLRRFVQQRGAQAGAGPLRAGPQPRHPLRAGPQPRHPLRAGPQPRHPLRAGPQPLPRRPATAIPEW